MVLFLIYQSSNVGDHGTAKHIRRMRRHFLSSQRRSLYHVTNESSVKDKHDLYLSSRHAAWCHLSLNVPFHCGGRWYITDLCTLWRKLLSPFWLAAGKDTPRSKRHIKTWWSEFVNPRTHVVFCLWGILSPARCITSLYYACHSKWMLFEMLLLSCGLVRFTSLAPWRAIASSLDKVYTPMPFSCLLSLHPPHS